MVLTKRSAASGDENVQQVFNIIMSPDFTFYKLHSDIDFTKVLSLAMRVRTIFRKTLLKVYSTLKSITGNIPLDLELTAPGRQTRTTDCHINKLWHFTDASLFAMEHFGNMQGEEGLPF